MTAQEVIALACVLVSEDGEVDVFPSDVAAWKQGAEGRRGVDMPTRRARLVAIAAAIKQGYESVESIDRDPTTWGGENDAAYWANFGDNDARRDKLCRMLTALDRAREPVPPDEDAEALAGAAARLRELGRRDR